MSKYLLIVHSEEADDREREPFLPSGVKAIPDGMKAFGPYLSQAAASEAGRTFLGSPYSWRVLPMIHLSEALDHPAGFLWQGDSPDE